MCLDVYPCGPMFVSQLTKIIAVGLHCVLILSSTVFSQTQGSYVAVKVFHEHAHVGKPDDLRELEVLRQLVHSNIIKLLTIEKMVSPCGLTL